MTSSDVVALVDMDGTLCDFAGAMRRDLEYLRGPGEVYPESLHARLKSQPEWWYHAKPIGVGVGILHLLNQKTGIHVLTHGSRVPPRPWIGRAERSGDE